MEKLLQSSIDGHRSVLVEKSLFFASELSVSVGVGGVQAKSTSPNLEANIGPSSFTGDAILDRNRG